MKEEGEWSQVEVLCCHAMLLQRLGEKGEKKRITTLSPTCLTTVPQMEGGEREAACFLMIFKKCAGRKSKKHRDTGGAWKNSTHTHNRTEEG